MAVEIFAGHPLFAGRVGQTLFGRFLPGLKVVPSSPKIDGPNLEGIRDDVWTQKLYSGRIEQIDPATGKPLKGSRRDADLYVTLSLTTEKLVERTPDGKVVDVDLGKLDYRGPSALVTARLHPFSPRRQIFAGHA